MPISTANFLGRYAIAHKNYLQTKNKLAVGLARTDTESEKLINITEGARDNLIKANTVFPFVLFPDTITVDRQKLTITHRSFFRTSSTISVQIDDVQVAKVDVGPFFGSVHLASKYFVDNIQSINFLKRSDAIRIQRLLQGYMIAHHRKIDCSGIDNHQLVVLLNELGQSSMS